MSPYQRERVALVQVASSRAAELDAPASKSTAEARPNAYLGEDMGLPKPYGTYAPFKPTDAGVSNSIGPWGIASLQSPPISPPFTHTYAPLKCFPPSPLVCIMRDHARCRPQCGTSGSRIRPRFCYNNTILFHYNVIAIVYAVCGP